MRKGPATFPSQTYAQITEASYLKITRVFVLITTQFPPLTSQLSVPKFRIYHPSERKNVIMVFDEASTSGVPHGDGRNFPKENYKTVR